ncbi:MAG: hypothetical protein ACSLE1_20035, partial [Sphingobium sp.]
MRLLSEPTLPFKKQSDTQDESCNNTAPATGLPAKFLFCPDLPPAEWPRDYDSLDHGRDIEMPSKKHKPEEIIGKLREVEIVL